MAIYHKKISISSYTIWGAPPPRKNNLQPKITLALVAIVIFLLLIISPVAIPVNQIDFIRAIAQLVTAVVQLVIIFKK